MSEEKQLIPPLRPDLEFIKGPADRDGRPTYTIHDLLYDTYSKATWAQIQVMKHLTKPIDIDSLVALLNQKTTLSLTRDEVAAFCQGVVAGGLTKATTVRQSQQLFQEQQARKTTLFQKMIHHYLYFRVPLIRPDRFLDATMGLVKLLASTPLLWIYSLLTLYGVVSCVQRFDEYIATVQYFFNMKGVFIYSGSIIVLKIIHEFSHAYFAKGLGNRVRTMGVAFIVMWPVAFCDVTDCWRMKSRKKRLLVSFAGIIAELVIAGLSLFVWSIAPQGVVKSICFVLSSVTIISTVLVNLNPAMRFDGYYIFSDIMGIDNLQQSAFAYARCFFFRLFLGAKKSVFEWYSKRQKIVMVLYSVYTWIYRIFLYLGIAVLVYYKFTKLLGILLFLVEIIMFLVFPIIRISKSMKEVARFSLNTILTSAALVGGVIWAVVPFERSVVLPAVTVHEQSQLIFSPLSGFITDVKCKRGDLVKKGQLLLRVVSEELNSQIEITDYEVNSLKHEISQMSIEDSIRQDLLQRKEKLIRAGYKRDGLIKQLEQGSVYADIDGVVSEWDDAFIAGASIRRNSSIGKIVRPHSTMLKSYVDEQYLTSIKRDLYALFYKDYSSVYTKVLISDISPVKTEKIVYSALVKGCGGDIDAYYSRKDQAYIPRNTLYEIDLVVKDLESEAWRAGQRGYVLIKAPGESRIIRLYNYALRSLLRETSF